MSVKMEYCVTGGGVATSYCSSFPGTVVGAAGLVKLTAGEISEIRSAGRVGLTEAHLTNGYVYNVDGPWYGFSGNAYNPTGAHYIQCQFHNQQSWENMNQANINGSGNAWSDADTSGPAMG